MNWLLPLSVAQTAALAFLGFCILDLTQKTDKLAGDAARSISESSSPAPSVASHLPAEALTAADIRAILREEFATLRGANSRSDPGAPVTTAPLPTNTPAQSEVRRELEGYIARGRMTSLEVEQFLTKAAELPAEQREQMIRKLTGAINSGKLDARL